MPTQAGVKFIKKLRSYYFEIVFVTKLHKLKQELECNKLLDDEEEARNVVKNSFKTSAKHFIENFVSKADRSSIRHASSAEIWCN